MKRHLFALIAALGATFGAHAQPQTFPRNLTLSWINPTQYVDGTLIGPMEHAGTRVSCSRNGGSSIVAQFVNTNGTGQAQSQVFANVIPQPGTYVCFAWAVVIGNIESDASNAAEVKHVGQPRAIVIEVR